MTDPHEAAPDEDPEAHIGQERPDPWGTGTAPAPPRGAEDGVLPPDWPLWFGES